MIHWRLVHVLERFTHNALALLAVTTILFFMFRLMPGTPLAAFINENLNADQQQAMLEQFGLDKPMWRQYFIYLGNLLQGEMGLSFFQRRPVTDDPARSAAQHAAADADLADHRLHLRRPRPAPGSPGSAAPGSRRCTIPLVLATRAAPEFWLGMVLLAVFAFTFGWFPSGGASQPGCRFPNRAGTRSPRPTSCTISHCPLSTLAIYLQGLPLLLMRSNMLEVMQEEFVTMARMKGSRSGASSSATPRATRCCRSAPPWPWVSACRSAATS